MKIHKTIGIGRQENKRNNKILSGTKKCRYFTFVMVPVLLLLIYVCVLKSVNLKKQVVKADVATKKYESSQKSFKMLDSLTDNHKANDFKMTYIRRLKRNMQTDETTRTQRNDSAKAAVNLKNPVGLYISAAIKCQEYQNNCTLTCTDGSVSFLDENIDYFKPKCPNMNLNLIIAKCEFNFGILQQSFFYSATKMALLSINECNLQTIKETAFQHQNAQALQTLLLINNQLLTLKENTFDGLVNLVQLQFVQNPLSTIFRGNIFLKPLANNLKEAVLQPSVNCSEVYDPLYWWQGLQMNNLTKLDLSNTNFQGILNSATFQPFKKLEVLILFNCNLFSIEADIFDFITNNFKYLDLQYNHLMTLDSNLLQKINMPYIEINLNLNDWLCECEEEMLQYFACHNVTLTEDLVCSCPQKWQHMKLKQVIEECTQDEATSATTIISSSVTISTILPHKESSTEKTTKKAFTTSTSGQFSSAPDTTTTTEFSTITFTTIEKSTTIGLPSISTSESTTNPTLKPPQDLISIECFLNQDKTETFQKDILNSEASFTLNIISSTTVTLTVEADKILPHFGIMYFTNYTNYTYKSDVKEINYIMDLKPFTAYVFCLIVEPSLIVSPFGCQAGFMVGKEQQKIWLLQSDKIWFISLVSVLTILLFLVSIFITFKILRHYPDWLSTRSGEVSLATRNSSMQCQSLDPSSLSRSTSHYLSSVSPLQIVNNNDDQIVVYNSQHAVPLTIAPAVENCKISGITSSSSGTKCRTSRRSCSQVKTDYLDIIEDDPDYQTIDYYEEIHYDMI